MTGVPYLEATGVSKAFPVPEGLRQVLANVCLSMERGDFVSVLGAMGTGKSTLLSVLAGLIPPDAGTVIVDGEPVRGFRRDAAIVFQHYSLLPWLTALENVRLAVDAAFPGMPRHAQREQARRALEQVGLGDALNRRPRELSGGMRQRVAIARAFATRPLMLFLDEPFGALDALTREVLQAELAQLCSAADRPVTVLMVTNSVEEAILLSDRIVPILAGPPATLGTPIAVDLPRPRTAAHLSHDERASRVRAHVVAALTAMRRPRRGGASAALTSAPAGHGAGAPRCHTAR